ncbi:MAG: hypothetical protein GF334_02760, partial [Candidatus Altiarchaeales archaeon]|nr:hypothetical protein [Candidatus Altiarchaeales archaeon]
MSKIWVNEWYESAYGEDGIRLTAYDSMTPCVQDEQTIFLKDIKGGKFKVFRGTFWEEAWLSDKREITANFRFEFDVKSRRIDSQRLVNFLSDLINSPEAKEKLERMGMKKPRTFVT